MLLYNHNKKLIGIDEEDLNILGFKHAQALLAVCDDIAELFVKKPGYIYDFKNFEWIDFVLNADAEVTKAIVQTSKKHFTCDIVIKPFYMADAPDEMAYAIYLQHIHALNASETTDMEEVSAAPVAAPIPPVEPVTEAPAIEPIPEPVSFEVPPVFDDEAVFNPPEYEPVPFESPVSEHEDELPAAFAKPLEIEDDLFMDTEPEPVAETLPEIKTAVPAPAGIYTPDEQEYIDKLTVSDSYIFDPHVASDELGLPVDLIEEFVGDFTKQSHEFYDELFDSAAKSDFDNVKILSHKLKGVAANLRVEDALEMLTIINNSHNQTEVEANLKAFYRVINKLEGKELPSIVPAAAPIAEATPVISEAMKEPIFEQPQEMSEVEDDDIYSFDLPTPEPEPSEPIDTIETAPNEEPVIEDLYAPVPEAPTADDDLYSMDTLLAEPEQTIEEVLPRESASKDLYPDFNDEEFELPPMDMSLLNEPAVETPPSSDEPTIIFNYDANKAAAELGLPTSLVEELQKDFSVDTDACRSEFEEAIALSQTDGWQSCAATLKGVADNLRMTEIAETLRVLTQTNDPQEAEKSMQQLYSYVKQL